MQRRVKELFWGLSLGKIARVTVGGAEGVGRPVPRRTELQVREIRIPA